MKSMPSLFLRQFVFTETYDIGQLSFHQSFTPKSPTNLVVYMMKIINVKCSSILHTRFNTHLLTRLLEIPQVSLVLTNKWNIK